MATYTVIDPSGNEREIEGPDGATDEQIIGAARRLFSSHSAPVQQPAPKEATAGDYARYAGRSAALAAGSLIDGALAPIASVVDLAAAPVEKAIYGDAANQIPTLRSRVSDLYKGESAGSPFPAASTGSERLLSAAAGGMGAVTPFVGAGGVLAGSGNASTAAVGELLKSAAGLQVLSGGAAGVASEAAAQNGAGAGGQLASGFAGAIVPFALSALTRKPIPTPGTARIEPVLGDAGVAPVAIEANTAIAKEAVESAGYSWAALADAVKSKIVGDVARASSMPGALDPVAASRKAIYENLGLTPTRALITRNFDDALREQNLLTEPKVGDQLRSIYAQNNAAIKSKIESLAPGQALPNAEFGAVVQGDLRQGKEAAKRATDSFYSAARAEEGARPAPLDQLLSYMDANKSALAGTPEVRTPVMRYLKSMDMLAPTEVAAETGSRLTRPATLAELTDLRQFINAADSPTTSNNARRLFGGMRSTLDQIEAQSGGPLFEKARAVYGQNASTWGASPLLKMATSDKPGFPGIAAIPESEFFDKAVLGSSAESFTPAWDRMSKASKDAVRSKLVSYIGDRVYSNQGTNEAGDIVASSARLSQALDSIGDEKIITILGGHAAEELKTLRTALREISNPPRGTAPQGSAPKLQAISDRLMGALRGIPRLGIIGDIVAQNVDQAVSARQAAKELDRALLLDAPAERMRTIRPPLLLPTLEVAARPATIPALLGSQQGGRH